MNTKYKSNVDINEIKIEPEDIDSIDGKYRYKLTIPFKKGRIN